MDSIALTTANSATAENYKLSLELKSNMSLEGNELVCMSNCVIYYTWKNFKSEYRNTRLMYRYENKDYPIVIPDGSYSVNDVNNYIHLTMRNNGHTSGPISLYANPTYNRVTAVVKENFELTFYDNLLETLGFEKAQMPITNEEVNGNLVPRLERVEAVWMHCNLVNNRHQRDSSFLYAFTPNAQFGSQLNVQPLFPQWKETRKTQDIREIEVWFTDQDNRPLDIEDKILVILQIKSPKNYKMNK